MLFNSIDFLIFFPIVVLLYFIVPKKIKMYWLLVASYYFYMCWNAKYAVLILGSTIVTYISGYLLEKVNKERKDDKAVKIKKWIVAGSLVANLGVLFCFKYLLFSIDILNSILGHFNVAINFPYTPLLPVGISFYTFQALSYTIDVYRGDVEAEKNFFRYALFVSFFPQLVAGPIERSKNLLSQLAEPKKFDYDKAREGFLLMLWGYFMKLVVAGRIAVYVDTVYGDISAFPGIYLIVAALLFIIQVYCDFAGYSTIAVGTAKVLGIDLMDNFKAPFLATSVADFWRRWHISLTSWFRDYVYFPLGGSRKGKVRKYINVMIVFLVSGLWHGANLTYVVWGGMNGLYQIIGELMKPVRDKLVGVLSLNRESLGHKLVKIACTFVLFAASMVFFRATSISEAIQVYKSIFTTNNIWVLLDGSLYKCGLDIKNFWLLIYCIVVMFAADFCKVKGIVIRNIIVKQDWWFRILFISFAIVFILVFGKWGPSFDKNSFIYFQF